MRLALYAAEAVQANQLTWPEAIVYIVFILAGAFMVWAFLR
jgi:hypothetical protein